MATPSFSSFLAHLDTIWSRSSSSSSVTEIDYLFILLLLGVLGYEVLHLFLPPLLPVLPVPVVELGLLVVVQRQSETLAGQSGNRISLMINQTAVAKHEL